MVDVANVEMAEKVSFMSLIMKKFEKIGYLRAATELKAMGYDEEAANCLKLANQ